MKLPVILFIFFTFFLFGACSPLQVRDSFPSASGLFAGPFNPSLWSDHEVYRDREAIQYDSFPTGDNEYVNYWIDYYSRGAGREDMKIRLERSNRYIDFMQGFFREEGLPVDLFYIAMVESPFEPCQTSPKGARGYWQFIKTTAKWLGMRVDDEVDDRCDLAASTIISANYLKYLYYNFGNWPLTIAAYNGGEGNMGNIISAHNSIDFWNLVKQRAFIKANLKETENFVPKVIAMRTIAIRPQAYGFYELKYHPPVEFEEVSLRNSITFSVLAEYFGVSYKELRRLNAKFQTNRIKVGEKEVKIRVPKSPVYPL